MIKTFTKEVSVPSMELNAEQTGVEPRNKKRVFTFKELNEYDQDQQKLHFKLNAVFESAFGVEDDEKIGSEKRTITIDTDGVHELTLKFINTCLITSGEDGTSDKQKEIDKKELLQNSKALYKLGSWLTTEKFLPFFLSFNSVSEM